ncbi:hypothetical protein [Haloferax namakaokahaiae]
MVGGVFDAVSLALYGTIALVAVGFWVVVLGGVVRNRPVFEHLVEDDAETDESETEESETKNPASD